ncbi:hypothetical protein Glove_9g123 [Diversispora epigaea]|uniref:Uncharacterized protein n=1 Tax=Diversispora epigaea TaxID=1348612 RepID=A0A397JQL7_9GLOM|nr:hypothetical protein Glove_9g123 [Diversispora epigaea]
MSYHKAGDNTLSTIKQNETLVQWAINSSARIIQTVYQNYKNRLESLATQAWNAMRDDSTSNDKKFLGMVGAKAPNVTIRFSSNIELELNQNLKTGFGLELKFKNIELNRTGTKLN